MKKSTKIIDSEFQKNNNVQIADTINNDNRQTTINNSSRTIQPQFEFSRMHSKDFLGLLRTEIYSMKEEEFELFQIRTHVDFLVPVHRLHSCKLLVPHINKSNRSRNRMVTREYIVLKHKSGNERKQCMNCSPSKYFEVNKVKNIY